MRSALASLLLLACSRPDEQPEPAVTRTDALCSGASTRSAASCIDPFLETHVTPRRDGFSPHQAVAQTPYCDHGDLDGRCLDRETGSMRRLAGDRGPYAYCNGPGSVIGGACIDPVSELLVPSTDGFSAAQDLVFRPATTSRISVNALGVETPPAFMGQLPSMPKNRMPRGSAGVALSANGRYAAFHSAARGLTRNVSDLSPKIYVVDLLTRAVEVVSTNEVGVVSNGNASDPTLSADGRYVCFTYAGSTYDSLGYGTNQNVLVKDRHTGRLFSASGDSTGNNHSCVISGDGLTVVFISEATDLDPGKTTTTPEVFLRHLGHGYLRRVTEAPNGGGANAPSSGLALSHNGCLVVFATAATNLVEYETWGVQQLYTRDVCNDFGGTPRFMLVSTGSNGDALRPGFVRAASCTGRDCFEGQFGGPYRKVDSCAGLGCFAARGSDTASITAHGQLIAFTSYSFDAVPMANRGNSDVFVKNLSTGELERISLGAAQTSARGSSAAPHLSPDGRYVAFESEATNLLAQPTPEGFTHVFTFDRVERKTLLVSRTPAGGIPSGEARCMDANQTVYPAATPPHCGASDVLFDVYRGAAPRVGANGNVVWQADSSELVNRDRNEAWDVFLVNADKLPR